MRYSVGFRLKLIGREIMALSQNATTIHHAFPEYHAGMLIVQMQPLRQTARPSAIAAALRESVAGELSVGMAALTHFERAGLVKRVTPIARIDDREPVGEEALIARAPGGFRSAAAIMATASSQPPSRPDAGLSLIELQRHEDTESLRHALASDPTVQNVSRVPVRYLLAPRKPAKKPTAARTGVASAAPTTALWNLEKINWAQARALPGFKDAATIKVAVLDTGIDETHPDLRGRIGHYVHSHPDLPTASSANDIIGHGTHVAGTIAANIDNNVGINGICTCDLNIWKIFDDIPDPDREPPARPTQFVYFVDPAMYLRALIDCQDRQVNVVNLSIGGPGAPDFAETQAFSRLLSAGTIVVAAMGNERQEGSPISFPAAIPGIVAVGATSITDRVALFSNRGNHISISAPGAAIWSTLPGNPGQFGFEAVSDGNGGFRQGKPSRRETDYDAWDGTSMASPHVAAATALYLANGGQGGPTEVRNALSATAAKVSGMGGRDFHPDYGHGRLDLEALLRKALGV
jgi:subtilisin family serine protease